MSARISGSISKFWFGLFVAVPLGGCAIAQPPVVTHSAVAKAAVGDFELAQQPDATGLRGDFALSLATAFSSQGISAKAGSRWVADFAVSSQPASIAVVPVGKESEASDPAKSGGVKAKWYHKCKPERVRGTLAIFDRNANTLAAKSEAHFIACPGDLAELDALASLLVRTATSNVAANQASAQE